MGKNKLRRFEENLSFTNLIQPKIIFPPEDHELKGMWNDNFFKNRHPIVLELGCGRGEYTLNLAEKFPEKNFIGIDWKGARLWRGAKTGHDQQIPNMGFLRIQIQNICSFFDTGEISEIWITFPDPQLNKPGERKRLTYPLFLGRYRSIMKPDGLVHLKTDSRELFEYTLDVIQKQNLPIVQATDDLYSLPVDEILSIKTTYEKIWLKRGAKICYLQFRINSDNGKV